MIFKTNENGTPLCAILRLPKETPSFKKTAKMTVGELSDVFNEAGWQAPWGPADSWVEDMEWSTKDE